MLTWSSPGIQEADAGTGTETTVTTDSNPRKSPGLVVNRGSPLAAAMPAIIRSATRLRGWRPLAITSAAIIPYCLAASTSNGSGLKGFRLFVAEP
jgi:hypothetical protein